MTMRRGRFAALAAAVSLASVPPAGAQVANFCGPEPAQSQYGNATFWGKQLSFSVVANGRDRVLMAEGGVGDDDGARLAQAIAGAGAIDEVWLSSPGGNLAEGVKMGRALRASGVIVRVPVGRACISACTIALLGGVLRTVDAGAWYGIHMFSRYGDDLDGVREMKRFITLADSATKEAGKNEAAVLMYRNLFRAIEQRSAQRAAELARYLIDMSASLDFLTGMFGQEMAGVCYLTPAGMQRYNVVNVR